MNWKHIIYSIIASLLGLLFMYIDTKLLDNPKSKTTYVKGMSMVGIITWILLYFMDGGFFTRSPTQTQFLPGLNEEIIIGPPDF